MRNGLHWKTAGMHWLSESIINYGRVHLVALIATNTGTVTRGTACDVEMSVRIRLLFAHQPILLACGRGLFADNLFCLEPAALNLPLIYIRFAWFRFSVVVWAEVHPSGLGTALAFGPPPSFFRPPTRLSSWSKGVKGATHGRGWGGEAADRVQGLVSQCRAVRQWHMVSLVKKGWALCLPGAKYEQMWRNGQTSTSVSRLWVNPWTPRVCWA